MPSPAMIFDFGNVVAFFDYGRSCARLVEELGLATTGDRLIEDLRGRGLGPLVARYERGELGDETFIDELTELLGVEAGPAQVRRAWSDIFWLNEPVARLIGRLDAAGYRLVLGSNTNGIHAEGFRVKFAETFRHFDALVLSYEIGCSKPSSAFYQACAAAAGRPVEECLFIDDLAENVAGARAAGMQAVHFLNEPQLSRELSQRGLEF